MNSCAALLSFALLFTGTAVHGQDAHKRKVPVVSKVISGSSHQAFSGRVESVDLERKLVNVNTVEGGNVEIFPFSKGVRVNSADGEKLQLHDLKPGTNVIIYFEQKGDRRMARQIVVLTTAPVDEKKKSSPPS